MKKLIIIFALIIFIICVQRTQAQIVEEGNIIVDVYYGWPNIYKLFLRELYVDNSATSVKLGSIGPFGSRFEFMLSDVVGIGADFGYVNTNVGWRDRGISGATYNYMVSAQQIHALMRLNFHFTQHGKVDAYGGLGAGYSNITFKFESDDHDYIGEYFDFFIPIGFRLCVGVRYFLSDNFALNTEIGFGGPFMSFGVSVRM